MHPIRWVLAIATAALLALPPGSEATPDRPEPISPLSGSRLPAFGTNLTWHLPDTATQYQLQVTPFNLDGPAINVIHNAEQQFRIPAPPEWFGLLPDMTYTWRLRATDKVSQAYETDSTWGLWSQDFTFRTPRASSAGIREVYPATGAGGLGTIPAILQWQTDNPQLFYFEVQASSDAAFNTDAGTAAAPVWWNLVHAGITRYTWTTPALQPGTVYYWRVRPRVQGDGEPAEWSRVFSFTTSG